MVDEALPENGDPNLSDQVKARIEGIGQAVTEGFAEPRPKKEIDPAELEQYPSYYRILEQFGKTGGIIGGICWQRHHDDERIDNVTIETVPRYKTSHMSGNEWRFTIIVKLWWKGHIIGQRGFGTLEAAIRILDHWINYMQEHVMFEHRDDPNHEWRIHYPEDKLRAEYCFQPNCAEKATSTFKLKKLYTRDGTTKMEMHRVHVVRYCQKHCRRGDSHMTDNDDNLVLLEGPGFGSKSEMEAMKKESQAAFGGVIDVSPE